MLLGEPRGKQQCAGDEALVIDAATGAISTPLRLPASVLSINSDHRTHVVAVTVNGDVILGDFTAAPSWITLMHGDYVSAAMW